MTDFTKPWVRLENHWIDTDLIVSVTKIPKAGNGYRTVLTLEGNHTIYLEMKASAAVEAINEAVRQATLKTTPRDVTPRNVVRDVSQGVQGQGPKPEPVAARMPITIVLAPEWMDEFQRLNPTLGQQLSELAPDRASGFLLIPKQAAKLNIPPSHLNSVTNAEWETIQAESLREADRAQDEFRAEERSRDLQRRGSCGVINPRTFKVCDLHQNPASHVKVNGRLQHKTHEGGEVYDWFVEA